MRHLAIYIPKYDCNHSLKRFKIYNICPKNASIKFKERDKNVKLMQVKLPQFVQIKFINEKFTLFFIVYFKKKYVT